MPVSSDMKNSVDSLMKELRKVKYPYELDYSELMNGHSLGIVQLFRFLFCDYSTAFSSKMMKLGYELAGKDDKKFVETVYLILRDVFNHKPQVNCMQFMQHNFPSRKISMAADVCRFVREYAASVTKPTVQKSVISGNLAQPKHRLDEPVAIPVGKYLRKSSRNNSGGNINSPKMPKTKVVKEFATKRPESSNVTDNNTWSGRSHSYTGVRKLDSVVIRSQSEVEISPREDLLSGAGGVQRERRQKMPVHVIMAASSKFENKGCQTGPWNTEQKILDQLTKLSCDLNNLMARVTVIEQGMELAGVSHNNRSRNNSFRLSPPRRNDNVDSAAFSDLPVEEALVTTSNCKPSSNTCSLFPQGRLFEENRSLDSQSSHHSYRSYQPPPTTDDHYSNNSIYHRPRSAATVTNSAFYEGNSSIQGGPVISDKKMESRTEALSWESRVVDPLYNESAVLTQEDLISQAKRIEQLISQTHCMFKPNLNGGSAAGDASDCR